MERCFVPPHTLIFLRSQQITLKDVIFPPDVIRAHTALTFYWSSAKEICRDWQKVLLFSASNSPSRGHGERTCILDTVQYHWWTKHRARSQNFHSHLHCFSNYSTSTNLLEVNCYPLTFIIYIRR